MTHRTGAIGNRAKLAAEAARLRAEGKLLREIAVSLRISMSYAQELVSDPEGIRMKQRRESYAQPCVDCGALTSGSEGRKKEPRCARCAPVVAGLKRRIPREHMIARIQEWAKIHGEPPAMNDWNPVSARKILHDEERAKRWEDSDGYWPWFTLIVREFGSWNKGVEAAGFSPRVSNGGGGNRKRHRLYGLNKKRPRKGHFMEALVLRKNGDGNWHEVGKVDARSYLDAVEALATEAGVYLALPTMNVFEVAPVQKLTAKVVSA